MTPPPIRSAPEPGFSYPPPSTAVVGGWLALVRVFGPGAIIASMTVGTGETVFAPRMGPLFGYTTFWVVLTAVVCKGLLVYGGARHLVLAGEHPMAAWARFGGPRGWVPALSGAVAVLPCPLHRNMTPVDMGHNLISKREKSIFVDFLVLVYMDRGNFKGIITAGSDFFTGDAFVVLLDVNHQHV